MQVKVTNPENVDFIVSEEAKAKVANIIAKREAAKAAKATAKKATAKAPAKPKLTKEQRAAKREAEDAKVAKASKVGKAINATVRAASALHDKKTALLQELKDEILGGSKERDGRLHMLAVKSAELQAAIRHLKGEEKVNKRDALQVISVYAKAVKESYHVLPASLSFEDYKERVYYALNLKKALEYMGSSAFSGNQIKAALKGDGKVWSDFVIASESLIKEYREKVKADKALALREAIEKDVIAGLGAPDKKAS